MLSLVVNKNKGVAERAPLIQPNPKNDRRFKTRKYESKLMDELNAICLFVVVVVVVCLSVYFFIQDFQMYPISQMLPFL